MSGLQENHRRYIALVPTGVGIIAPARLRRWTSALLAILLVAIGALPSYAHTLHASPPHLPIWSSASAHQFTIAIDIGEPDSGQPASPARHGHQCLACVCAHVALSHVTDSTPCLFTDHVRFDHFIVTHLPLLPPSLLLRPPRA